MNSIPQILKSLQTQRSQLQAELARLEAASAALKVSENGGARPRLLSEAARRRIAAAQKARWAKWRAERDNKK